MDEEMVEIIVNGKSVSKANTVRGLARQIRKEVPTPKVRGTHDALTALGMYASVAGLLIEFVPGRFAECEVI